MNQISCTRFYASTAIGGSLLKLVLPSQSEEWLLALKASLLNQYFAKMAWVSFHYSPLTRGLDITAAYYLVSFKALPISQEGDDCI
jgi:hypothetical protein